MLKNILCFVNLDANDYKDFVFLLMLTPMMTNTLSFCCSWRWSWQRFCLLLILMTMLTKILSFCWSKGRCWQRFYVFVDFWRLWWQRFCLLVDQDADIDLDADIDKDFVFLLIFDADVDKEIVFFVSGSSVHLIFWQGCPPVDEDCRRKPRKVRGVGSGLKNQYDTTERFKSSFCISLHSETGTYRE